MAMVYNLPTVDPGTEPLQRFDAPESKNVNAAQMVEQGQALTKAGTVMNTIVQNYQDDVATAKVKDADNRMVGFLTEKLHNPQTGFFSMNGEQAVNGQAAVKNDIDKFVLSESEKMTNPVEKQLFKEKVAAPRIAAATAQIYGHVHNQAKVWREGATKGRMELSFQTAIANSDDHTGDTFKTNFARGTKEAEELYTSMGLSAEAKALAVQNDQSKAHIESIQLLVSKDKALQAEKYFEEAKAKGQILPSLENNIRGYLNVAVDTVKGKAAGASLYLQAVEYMPDKINDAFPLEKMIKTINSDEGLTGKGKEHAIAMLDALSSKRNSGLTAAAQEVNNKLSAMLTNRDDKTGYQKAIEFLEQQPQITFSARSNLRDYADTFYGFTQEKRQAVAEAKAEIKHKKLLLESEARAEKRLDERIERQNQAAAAADIWLDDYGKGLKGNMTPQQILQTQGDRLGANTIAVSKAVQKMQEKLVNPQVTMTEFNRKIQIMYETPDLRGTLNFNPSSKDSDDIKKKLALFNDTLTEMSVAGSKGPGNQVSLDQAIRNATRKIDIPGNWWGRNTIEAFNLRFQSESVKREYIRKALKDAGKPVTDSAITQGLEKLNQTRTSRMPFSPSGDDE